jgi:hypothetical protein
LETAVDVQEVRKLDAYLKRVIGVLFVDDEDDDRSFQFQMAILEEDLADVG